MDEASKTRRVRGPDFERQYLSGKVIDIGAGTDPVCPWAEIFDVAEGDANFITRYRAPETYDTVHSSHCLEHLHDPKQALRQWWQLVRPGGYLVLVVPHEDLYEQGFWPSIFNPDHKATFRLDGTASWSPVRETCMKAARLPSNLAERSTSSNSSLTVAISLSLICVPSFLVTTITFSNSRP